MEFRRPRGSSLARKLTISFVAILFLITLLSYSSWHAISSVGGIVDSITSTSATEDGLVADITDAFSEMQDLAKRTQLAHAIRELEHESGTGGRSCSTCHAVDATEHGREEFESTGARVHDYIAALRPMMDDAKSREVLDSMQRNLDEWITLYRQYLVEAGADRFEAAHSIVTDRLLPLHMQIDDAAGRLMGAHRARLDRFAGEATQTTRSNRWLAFGLIGIAVIVLSGMVLALRRTSGLLHRITLDLGHRARQVAAMAGQVSSASHSAAQGACQQADSLHQVSSSSAEINTTAHRNAEKAGTSADLSAEFSRRLGEANERLGQLLTAMGEIQGASEKVAQIVRLIDGVAFQTNILSLNAAVEAARAGESGLGFAVVAGEVRNLAQRSAQAAKDTAVLIDEAIAAARNGMARLTDVSAAFQSLTKGAERVTGLAGEVRAGSLDQVQQVDQITRRLGHIQHLTDSASAGALQGARAGESLTGEAARLTELVSRLVSVVDGSEGDGETEATAAPSMPLSP